MNLYDFFKQALPLDEFLAKFGTDGDREHWKSVGQRVALSESQKLLLKKFKRETHVLVLAGAWCGDCVQQCPIFEHFETAAPALKVRYLDRDAYPAAQQALLVNDGKRVPVVVFFSEDGHEVARYGDRTLSKYRELVEQQAGESCGSDIVGHGSDSLARVTQDWLDQFERVQWILRLSPRLRRVHGD